MQKTHNDVSTMKKAPLLDIDENQDPSRLDIIIGWKLLSQNFKPFLGIVLFTFLASFLINAFFGSFYIMIQQAKGNTKIFENGIPIPALILLVVLQMFFILAFSNSAYGLSYDILSSGDMFAEFRGAFNYFRHYWWQYTVLSLVTGFLQFFILIPEFSQSTNNPWIEFLFYFGISLVSLILQSLFSFTFPSVTKQKKIRIAFQENWKIFKTNRKRVVKTLLWYNLIFAVPLVIITDLMLIIVNIAENPNIWGLLLLGLVIVTVGSTIVGGLRAIIVTRIYNYHIQTQKQQISEKTETENEEENSTKNIRLDSIYKKKKLP